MRGMLQARILEWVALPSSRGSSQRNDRTQVSHVAGRFFTNAWNSLGQNTRVGSLALLQRIFPTQRSNPGLPHCRWILDQLGHQGSSSSCKVSSCTTGKGFPQGDSGQSRRWIQPKGQEDPLEKGMTTHSRVLAWKIPRTEEPGGPQSLGSQRVRYDEIATQLAETQHTPSLPGTFDKLIYILKYNFFLFIMDISSLLL